MLNFIGHLSLHYVVYIPTFKQVLCSFSLCVVDFNEEGMSLRAKREIQETTIV